MTGRYVDHVLSLADFSVSTAAYELDVGCKSYGKADVQWDAFDNLQNQTRAGKVTWYDALGPSNNMSMFQHPAALSSRNHSSTLPVYPHCSVGRGCTFV